MPRARIGLKDVAIATGFSVNTVSLALRGSPRIPRETRDRIFEAARRLHYLPNRVARSLVNRETKTIGLVLTDIMNPTLTQVARALERKLGERGYSMMLAASDNDLDKERRAVEVFRSHQVDGILIYPTIHRQLDHLRALRERGYPIVLLAADPEAGIDAVAIDDRSGARIAVQHLVETGRRRIALLDPAIGLGNPEKFDGYAAALTDAGLTLDPTLLIDPAGHSATDGFEATPRVMRAAPSAIFCSNDSLALGVVRWCVENDVAVPGDLAVVGYDNIEAAAFGAVPITTVNYAADTLSGVAIELLMELIAAKTVLPVSKTVLISPTLVERQSSGIPFGRATQVLAKAGDADLGATSETRHT